MILYFQRLEHFYSGFDGALGRRFSWGIDCPRATKWDWTGVTSEAPSAALSGYILRLWDPGIHCTDSITGGVLESHLFALQPSTDLHCDSRLSTIKLSL